NGRRVPATDQLFWAGYPGMAHLPGTVAPAGRTKAGLPVGIQIVGPQYGDRTCIQMARPLEREYQGFVPPPAYASGERCPWNIACSAGATFTSPPSASASCPCPAPTGEATTSSPSASSTPLSTAE